ncbi:MAG: hypothetical protein AAF478_04360 [Pseudomonadota bacterium]
MTRFSLGLAVFAFLVQFAPVHSGLGIVEAVAKENCKVGYEWNRQTKKCEPKESSY